MRLAILISFITFVTGCSNDSGCDSLLDSIRLEFQQTNPAIADIQVLDAKLREPQYWIVARGITPTENQEESLENELFGVFVVDESFACVAKVVDVFPTLRWRDYNVWIESHGAERITIRGLGATYHDHSLHKSYLVEN